MLPKQAVVETPTPAKIRGKALPSARKRDALKAKDNKSTEDDMLRLRKRKLQLENIHWRSKGLESILEINFIKRASKMSINMSISEIFWTFAEIITL